jgi:hypothetical protein
MVRLLLVAEITVDEFTETPQADAQRKLDTFREQAQPSFIHGICLYRCMGSAREDNRDLLDNPDGFAEGTEVPPPND